VIFAAAVAVASSLPFLLPYYRVSRDQGFVRLPRDAVHFAASWPDYLATGARLHFTTWSRPFYERSNSATFPGVVAIGLVAVALARSAAWKDARCRMALAICLGGVLMSVLPRAPGYPWLHEHLPLMQAIRASSRFGILALLGVAVLAGYGVVRVRSWWGGTRAWAGVVTGLVLLVNAEAFRAPLWYARFTGLPSEYAALRDLPGAVIVEFPVPSGGEIARNAPYMLNSTLHWRPMLNGYSGFFPRSYVTSRRAIASFPDDRSLAALHALGITHVVIHVSAFRRARGATAAAAVAAHPALTRIAGEGDIQIYRLGR
jgi:hypothetical protein